LLNSIAQANVRDDRLAAGIEQVKALRIHAVEHSEEEHDNHHRDEILDESESFLKFPTWLDSEMPR
jgi:hypothetical protein